jgi:histidinol phosphatase-like PHP family hydrolase
MDRVVEAAARSGVAMEINNRYKLPSAAFIKRAKAGDVKFAFGTNNGDSKLGRLEYGLQMVKECGLKWQDFWTPRRERG